MHLTPKFDRLYVIFVVWLFLLFAVIFTLHISRLHSIKRTLTHALSVNERAWRRYPLIHWRLAGREWSDGMCVHVKHITYSFEWFNYVKHSHLHTVVSVVLVQSMNRCLIQVYAHRSIDIFEIGIGWQSGCVRLPCDCDVWTSCGNAKIGIWTVTHRRTHRNASFYSIEMNRKWI